MIIEDFLPPYLQGNEELKTQLKLFFYSGYERDRNYSGFYAMDAPGYLMQADVFNSLRAIDWDYSIGDYVNCYFPVMLISNTCDVTEENERTLNIKQSLFAPLIPLDEVLADLTTHLGKQSSDSFYSAVKRQDYSNLFYLPKNFKNRKEYIVFLDKIFWHPVENLSFITDDLDSNRFLSLSNWGYYLFLLKTANHFCRIPAEHDGREDGIKEAFNN